MLSRTPLRLLCQRALSARAEGILAINIAAVIFGTADLYGKLAISPFWIVATRAGFGALALAGWEAYRSELKVPATLPWGTLALSNFFLAVHWLTFFISVQHAGVAVATLTFATFPLVTVVIEALGQRRRLTRTEVLVGIVIVFAVALLIEPIDGGGTVIGAGAGLVSSLAYGFFWRVSRKLKPALSPAMMSRLQNAGVLALLAPTLIFAQSPPGQVIDWVALVALGVFNTAVMLLLYLYALKRISPATCSGFIALEPVYAIVFAALLFGEPITPWIVVSIVLIIGASMTLLRIEQQPPPPGM
jgi:drug/metabolite transporter (DMT)-like permease